MKKTFTIVLALLSIIACKDIKSKEKEIIDVEIPEYTEFITPDYELHKPSVNAKAVLILFGGYPEVAIDVKREFKVLEVAKRNNIAVLFSNFNRKLWFQENEKQLLTKTIQNVIIQHELPTDNIFIGGFSSGGVVSLLISDFIVATKEFNFNPKGVFIVDSPIDLAALYFSSEKNIKRNFSDVSVQESTWLKETLGKQFGNPHNDITAYQEHSVFTSKTMNIDNIKNLKNTKIRLYTEPDTTWWKKNRMADFEQMNAYYIKKLSEKLKASEFKSVEYIPTKNKGYRANGDRHPHSWAIVDTNDLINWMLKE